MAVAARVVLVTETGDGAGLGRLRRCQALAAALEECGAVPRLVIAGGVESSGARVPASAFDWRREPAGALALVRAWRADAVVVDSYAATTEFFAQLRSAAPWVVAIDDIADRELPVSLVVNGGESAPALAYRTAADTVLRRGPRYALLDPAFAADPGRCTHADVERVLVTFGGDAAGEVIEAALAAVRVLAPRASVDVAVGPYATELPDAESGVTVHRGLASLRPLMLAADAAVTGGGMTLYECLATATPTVGVCLADNQRPNLEGLSRAGLILRGDPAIAPALERLLGDAALRESMAARGRVLVDGGGAARVAREIIHAVAAMPADACRR